MQHASGKDYDPSAWAKQRQERIKRALQVSVPCPPLALVLGAYVDVSSYMQQLHFGCSGYTGAVNDTNIFCPALYRTPRILGGREDCPVGM